jgi:sarcosine oxidase subunit alpha
MPEKLTVIINGVAHSVERGSTVAAALLSESVFAFRTSMTGAPRAPLCGMGICFECRVTIDDHPNMKSCQLTVREGMAVQTS